MSTEWRMAVAVAIAWPIGTAIGFLVDWWLR
jgi:hypothetical protein